MILGQDAAQYDRIFPLAPPALPACLAGAPGAETGREEGNLYDFRV
jgi:hypothetical protein